MCFDAQELFACFYMKDDRHPCHRQLPARVSSTTKAGQHRPATPARKELSFRRHARRGFVRSSVFQIVKHYGPPRRTPRYLPCRAERHASNQAVIRLSVNISRINAPVPRVVKPEGFRNSAERQQLVIWANGDGVYFASGLATRKRGSLEPCRVRSPSRRHGTVDSLWSVRTQMAPPVEKTCFASRQCVRR